MANRNTLSVDVGASHVKAQVLGVRGAACTDELKIETPPSMTPKSLTALLVDVAGRLQPFDRISIGLPGIVVHGIVYALPVLSDERMRRFELVKTLEKKLACPVRAVNDAEMHGLGVIRRRGVELVLTFGTGLGTALFLDGAIGTRLHFISNPEADQYEGGAYGDEALADLGTAKWNTRVKRLIESLRHVTNFDRCYVGGGNAKHLHGDLRDDVEIVDNSAARLGGVRLWEWDIQT